MSNLVIFLPDRNVVQMETWVVGLFCEVVGAVVCCSVIQCHWASAAVAVAAAVDRVESALLWENVELGASDHRLVRVVDVGACLDVGTADPDINYHLSFLALYDVVHGHTLADLGILGTPGHLGVDPGSLEGTVHSEHHLVVLHNHA